MNYYVERVAQVVFTFTAATFIAYTLFRMLPGSPVRAIVTQELNRQREQYGEVVDYQGAVERAERLTGINPDTGIVEGYVDWMQNFLIAQEFGTSISRQQPVMDLILERLPWSMFLTGYGLVFGFTLVLVIGTLMAWKEGTKTDSVLTVGLLSVTSIPYFVVAVILLAILGYTWGIFPTEGRVPVQADPGFNLEFMTGVVSHGILPIFSTVLVGVAGALNMRANTVRIMGSEYIRSARLRGLSNNRVLTRYLMRNSILPIYTGMALTVAAVLSSNVVTEYVFQYPAMGDLLINALNARDYPLLLGTFVMFSGVTLMALLFADLTYGLIDPRAGTGESREAY